VEVALGLGIVGGPVATTRRSIGGLEGERFLEG
jgi:hypothetical protein